jgi:hypothetical protein
MLGVFFAGYLLKLSDKNDWAKRWFVLNEKTCKVQYHDIPRLQFELFCFLFSLQPYAVITLDMTVLVILWFYLVIILNLCISFAACIYQKA